MKLGARIVRLERSLIRKTKPKRVGEGNGKVARPPIGTEVDLYQGLAARSRSFGSDSFLAAEDRGFLKNPTQVDVPARFGN